MDFTSKLHSFLTDLDVIGFPLPTEIKMSKDGYSLLQESLDDDRRFTTKDERVARAAIKELRYQYRNNTILLTCDEV